MITDIEKKNLIELAKFGTDKERYMVAIHPEAPEEALLMLIADDKPDIYYNAIENPNITQGIFDFIINELGIMSHVFYIKLVNNVGFKKGWVFKYIDFLCKIPQLENFALSFLDDTRFFNNEDEWLDLYIKIKDSITNIYELPMGSYWTDFFNRPPKIYSEKMVLAILDDFGDLINTYSNGNFDMIFGGKIEKTPKIINKIFELTQNINYAPDTVKDIFVF